MTFISETNNVADQNDQQTQDAERDVDINENEHALKQSGDNMSAAARLLGVPRDYLRYRLEKKQRSEPQV